MIWPFECTPSSMTGASCLHPHGSIKHGIRRVGQHDSCQGSAQCALHKAGTCTLQACALYHGPFLFVPRGLPARPALLPCYWSPTRQSSPLPSLAPLSSTGALSCRSWRSPHRQRLGHTPPMKHSSEQHGFEFSTQPQLHDTARCTRSCCDIIQNVLQRQGCSTRGRGNLPTKCQAFC